RAGDDDVAQQRNVCAEAHRIAVHRRNDRLLALENVVDDLSRLGPHVGTFRIRTDRIAGREVAARTERATHAGQDQYAQFAVVREIDAEARELRVHATVDGVQSLRTVQRDDRNAVVAALDLHGLIVLLSEHGVPQLRWRRDTDPAVQ